MNHIFKHLEFHQKYSAVSFSIIFSVFGNYYSQTLSFMSAISPLLHTTQVTHFVLHTTQVVLKLDFSQNATGTW